MRLLPPRSGLATAAIAAALLVVCGPSLAAKPAPDKLPVTRVQDLHYGDVLFYFYQDENFEALTRLEAYDQWHQLPHHAGEAELLAGGLYLQLGMHNEAGRRFESLLRPEIPAGVRNRAWFYLAKVWYARGYLDKTEHALTQITGMLPPSMEAEKQHLLANALMRLGRFDAAIALLQGWSGPEDWMTYARFNLGVALARSNRLADADPLLTMVGTLNSDNDEMLALKDKANLALGFAYLQAEQPARAKPVLERVRLNGAQSNKALLGVGWAAAALGNYRDALAPWLELHGRNLLDAAVQESLLAVPYAFGKLEANAQAADYYEKALESFSAESQRIDGSIQRIGEVRMLDALLADDTDKGHGWFWQLQALPDAPESRYLYTVLAGNDFQEGLKNYRDLDYLGSQLQRWDENMAAYTDMVQTREKAYADRVPRTDALLASKQVDNLEARRDTIETQLNEVVTANDVAALGTPEERDQWQRVLRLEEAAATAPGSPELGAQREKLRLIKGVLQWRLTQNFRERLWNERRQITQLDAALAEAHNRWVRVERARQSAPSNTGEFAVRIAVLQSRLSSLRVQLAVAAEAQNDFLERMAITNLQAQKERIATYEVQARFALATIYDRASEPKPSPTAPAPDQGPVQEQKP
ncbi:MAG: hypothetical protein ABIT36_13385 [Steroidobacteraceae bacterium]